MTSAAVGCQSPSTECLVTQEENYGAVTTAEHNLQAIEERGKTKRTQA